MSYVDYYSPTPPEGASAPGYADQLRADAARYTAEHPMTDEQVDRLRGDLEFVTAHRGAHYQGMWWNSNDLGSGDPFAEAMNDDGTPKCGTAGCLAGWSVARAYPQAREGEQDGVWGVIDPDLGRLGYFPEVAADLYGLPENLAHDHLFLGSLDLHQQWEAAALISGGRITVPAVLPTDDAPHTEQNED